MKIRSSLMLALSVISLASCTRHVSRDITPEGSAGEIVFPAIEEATPKGGTRPLLEALGKIGPGVGKDTLYTLIGVPHHREGYWYVREWDYLFNLPRGDQWVQCQYKIIFDKEGRGQSFHWQPAECADLVKPQPMTAAQRQRFEISGDALFAFGRSGIDDISPGGREQLATIAQQLRDSAVQYITVTGHTDLIGDAMANQTLSQRRADAVREFLVAQGVSAGSISAQGRGEAEPVKACDENTARDVLIACLQPNRRVEIVGWAEK